MTIHTVGSGGDFATFSAITWGSVSSGDVVRLLNSFTEQMTVPTAVSGVLIDLNGYTIDAEETRNYCIDLEDVTDKITIINGTLTGAVENNLRWTLATNAGSTVRTLTLRDIQGGYTKQLPATPATPAVTTGTGILVDTTGYIPAIARINFINCSQDQCGKHGFDFRGNVQGSMTNPKARRNGTSNATSTYGGHGITFHPLRQDWASQAWTSQGGGVYSKVRQNANDTPTHVINWTDGLPLIRTSGTETTPGVGEWGYDSGTIYVQLEDSADPSTHEIRYLRVPFGPVDIYDPICSDTKTDDGPGEGNGIAFDSVSYRITIHRGKLSNNQGHGLNAVMALDCSAIQTLFDSNSTRGVRFQNTSLGCSLVNCAAVLNGGEGVFMQGAVNATVKNVLSANNTGANLSANAAAQSTLTESNNASYNGGSADIGFTPVITSDPRVSSPDYKTEFNSPLYRAGTAVTSMQEYLSDTPSIGIEDGGDSFRRYRKNKKRNGSQF